MEEAVRAVMNEVDLTETLLVVTADHSHVLTLGGLATLRGNPIFGQYIYFTCHFILMFIGLFSYHFYIKYMYKNSIYHVQNYTH